MLKASGSWKLSLVIPILFLVIGVITLPHYGFNSDEPFHFYRGQAYLHFFLTGNKDYKDLPPYPRANQKRCQQAPLSSDCQISPPSPSDTTDFLGNDQTYERVTKKNADSNLQLRRSFFQHDAVSFNEVIQKEDGHPPLGGILAALTNRIFYQNLKIMPDVESHHLAEILLSFFVLAGVAIFTYFEFGLFVSLVSTFAIATYPLFFAESHFNVKDPPETVFFGLTIITFYYAIVKERWRLMIVAAIFAGMALGIKFNILFLPFILGPWLLLIFIQGNLKFHKKNKKLFLSLLFFPVVTLLVFYILWPYLWPDPLGNIQKNIAFYKSSGLGTPSELKNFIFYKINLFPITWIVTTTPLPVLILSLVGTFYSLAKLITVRNSVYLLLLLWLWVPIIRVSLPNFAIYGGIRHIMEFVLPLGIMTGLGALTLWQLLKKIIHSPTQALILIITLLISFAVFNVWELIRLHPNENVYFNQLIGGLKGAREKNIPFWGNSYGNAYLQGVNWLNENAEPQAKLGLPVATMANLPRLSLRSDIFFNNGFWSGPNRVGEYEMEQTHDFPQKSWYSFAYYETYLNPVYEVKVDGVPILKIWKNDLQHTKEGFKEELVYPHELKIYPNEMLIDLKKTVFLTRLIIDHDIKDCQKLKGGYMSLSMNGVDWSREIEPVDFPQVPPEAVGWDDDTFVFLFAAKPTRLIRLNTIQDNPCVFKRAKIMVKGLKE